MSKFDHDPMSKYDRLQCIWNLTTMAIF